MQASIMQVASYLVWPGTQSQFYSTWKRTSPRSRLCTMSAADVQAIRDLAKEADAENGERYPPALASVMFVETPAPN
ncbi:hypothetical protein B0H10DRAFT_2070777 [Mycena sp. CBHHK59/15]|nr:hypothetical protein B0H10DRAFT_2070777 [Mycena sp. CBHHK59/15]